MKYPEIAKRIKIALNNKGMKARELSLKCDLNESMISHYVNGRYAPSNISAAKMADVLDVNPLWLMGFDVPMKEDRYYIDEKAREIAEFLYTNPQYGVLFDASRKVKPEDLEIVKRLIEKFSD